MDGGSTKGFLLFDVPSGEVMTSLGTDHTVLISSEDAFVEAVHLLRCFIRKYMFQGFQAFFWAKIGTMRFNVYKKFEYLLSLF